VPALENSKWDILRPKKNNNIRCCFFKTFKDSPVESKPSEKTKIEQ
jgi:hypothetical protein